MNEAEEKQPLFARVFGGKAGEAQEEPGTREHISSSDTFQFLTVDTVRQTSRMGCSQASLR